jgi:hypothetical protein
MESEIGMKYVLGKAQVAYEVKDEQNELARTKTPRSDNYGSLWTWGQSWAIREKKKSKLILKRKKELLSNFQKSQHLYSAKRELIALFPFTIPDSPSVPVHGID